MTYYFDMDGVLANFHKEAFKYANAINRNWIANLDPFMGNVEIVKTLIKKGEVVYILTKAASENARLGKMDWLTKYIPEINLTTNFICIVGSGKKVDHMRTNEGILVDDDMKNINPWKKAGFGYIFVEAKGETITL